MVTAKRLSITLLILGMGAIIGIASFGLIGAFDSNEPSSSTEIPLSTAGNLGQFESAGDTRSAEDLAATDTLIAIPENEGLTVSESGVVPDPDYKEKLKAARLSTLGWDTDFSLHTVPFGEVRSGGIGRDGIPPLDDPKFDTPDQADQWILPNEPVIALILNGDARAYPLQILIWHEIVNDVVGGLPTTVTFCPLCNSAIAFDRILEGVIYDFGTSGKLRNSDLVMWDRQTETWWQQFTGEGIIGKLAGKQLTIVPASIISWEDFKLAFPDGKVLNRETGFEDDREYGVNPYAGYDRVDNPPFLFDGELDGRLLPKERVAAVTVGDEDAAFPFFILEEERVVNYMVGDQDLVVFFETGTTSALDLSSIRRSKEVGASGVFKRELDGQALTFSFDGNNFVDNETNTTWNILGQAVEGPFAGAELTPIIHADHFRFSWAAFKPFTRIYLGQN